MNRPTGNTDYISGEHTRRERCFIDSDGARWTVYEQVVTGYDRRSGLSLIFASESAVRRVRDYPEDWLELSEAELAALSWKA